MPCPIKSLMYVIQMMFSFFFRRDDIRIADVKDEDDEYGRGEDEYGRGGGEEDEDEDRADQRLEEAAAAVSDPRLRRLAASRGTSRGRGRHGSEDDEDDQEEDGENDVRHRRRHNRSE